MTFPWWSPWAALGGAFVLAVAAVLSDDDSAPAGGGGGPALPPGPPVSPGALPTPGTWAGMGFPPVAQIMAQEPKAEARWSQDQKLAAATADLQLPELLRRLRTRGMQPKIAFTWRGLHTQDVLLAEKRSKVSFSFHNAVDAQGFPAAMAADVFDARFGWGDNVHDSPKTLGALAFFKALGQEAKAMGLAWGGDWSPNKGFWSKYGVGWDPAHVQSAPNSALGHVRAASLQVLLGPGVIKQGSGGYVYRQWPNGYLQVLEGPALVGQLLLPKGSRDAWQAITNEIGPPPTATA